MSGRSQMTKMGWFITNPGKEFDQSTMLLTQKSHTDYELCQLDVLGLEDAPEHDQNTVHVEFKEQLEHSPQGWYETGLPWRGQPPGSAHHQTGKFATHVKLD